MSYVQKVLQPGEQIRYLGSVSWVLYLIPLLVAIVGAAISLIGPWGWIIGGILFAIALVLALRAWFIRWTTEIAVTNLRVIYAKGFIQRRSVEIHMDKVESVDVDQSVMGRLFDYGTVRVQGTGGKKDPFPNIDRPIEFRNQVVAS